MKKLLLAIIILALAACAKTPPPEPAPDAASGWNKMLELSDSASDSPFRAQFSLRFGPEGNTRRLSGVMWGNNPQTVRTDLQAGIGVVAARAVESDDRLVIYIPQERRAWFRDNTAEPIILAGAPIPLNLRQLALLVTGRYAQAFGKDYRNSKFSGPATVYELDSPPGGELLLAGNGLPVRWQRKDGWQLEIGYDEKHPDLPHRLAFSAPHDNHGIMLIRELTQPAPEFTREQLALDLPDNTPFLPLTSR